jgi:hypothetical protein
LWGRSYEKVKCLSEWHKWFKETSHVKIINEKNAYYVEMLKQLHEVVHRKGPELWPNDWILHHDNIAAHKALRVKQFLAQK